jgi:hypothetical protein
MVSSIDQLLSKTQVMEHWARRNEEEVSPHLT